MPKHNSQNAPQIYSGSILKGHSSPRDITCSLYSLFCASGISQNPTISRKLAWATL